LQEKQKHITRLIKACKNGDQPAQFEIYKLYYKAMYNTSLRIVHDSFEAEDVMQEAFLNAFTKLETFKAEVSFGAWLKRIVINKSLTQIKKNKRFEEIKLEVVSNETESEEDTILIDDRIDYNNLKAKEILTTMNKLKDNYRVALNLSLIEGYDNEEVAEIMNLTNENCRTTISRAKRKLRKLMTDSTIIN
jgi:RNA polymerase sigma-70 factor (ECF subfamily)